MNEDEKLGRRYALFVLSSIAIVFGFELLILLITGAKFDPEAWTVFLNAKIPLIWTQTTVALGTVIVFDLLIPGGTIMKIMDLRGKNNTPENRRTAAIFLIGIGGIAAYTVKGGF
jgi:hypothetical protein